MLDRKGRTIEQRWYESSLGHRFLRSERWVLSMAETWPTMASVLIFPYLMLCTMLAILPFPLVGLAGVAVIGPEHEMLAEFFFGIFLVPAFAVSVFVMPWCATWYLVAMSLFFGHTSLAERKSQRLQALGA